MPKVASALCALLLLASAAGAQERGKAGAPKLSLTLTVEKTDWRPGEAMPVSIRIENVSGDRAELPTVVYFRADNRRRREDFPTMAHGVLSSPVSLTKVYGERVAGRCQNDLTADRVESVKGTNIVAIFPAKGRLTFEPGEVKEFSFDLAGMCWKHAIGAAYAHSDIFSLAGRYALKAYRLHFEMGFPTGQTVVEGQDVPAYEHLKSNAVEVAIN